MTRDSAPPELFRPLRPASIPATGYRVEITANPEERSKLARRFNLPSVEDLSCSFTLTREPGAAIHASGVLSARVTQICRVTLAPFPASIEEHFTVRFVPEGCEAAPFDLEAPDEIPYSGGTLDLGEVAAEQLALALDPWPRKPGATLQVH
ncbi:MAG: YceD family protein [Acetobacteraceae bacterium]